MTQRVAVVIPARYHSTRLPGKPLIPLAGKPMIQRVYERALRIPHADTVLVATDDARIAEAVTAVGGRAVLTDPTIPTGSERVGAAVRDLDVQIVVNLQGDEPLIAPEAVGEAIAVLRADPALSVATLGFPLTAEGDWRNPAVVKVICDATGNALYFSRAPIPYFRDTPFHPVPGLYRHLGVYVYRKSFLMKYLEWPQSRLEFIEQLEQLRILERGHPIRVVESPTLSPGVDTPEDVERVQQLLNTRGDA